MKHHKRPFLQPCVVVLQWDADAVLNKEEQKKTSEILDAFHFESFFQFWTHTFCKNERKHFWNQPNIYKTLSISQRSFNLPMDGRVECVWIFSSLFSCWFRGLFSMVWVLYSLSRWAVPSRQPTHTRTCAFRSISVSPLPALDETARVCLKREMCQSTSR